MFTFDIYNKNLKKVEELSKEVPELKIYHEQIKAKYKIIESTYSQIDFENSKIVLSKTGFAQYMWFTEYHYSNSYSIDDVRYYPNTILKDFTNDKFKEWMVLSVSSNYRKNINNKKTKGQILTLFNGKLNHRRYGYFCRSHINKFVNFLYHNGYGVDRIDENYKPYLIHFQTELPDNPMFNKEYSMNKEITSIMINSLSEIKDYRRININYIKDMVENELKTRMLNSLNVGDKVKLIKDVNGLTKGKEYVINSRYVSYEGVLKIKINNDNDIQNEYDYSYFEEVKQLRLDKLNSL